LTGNAGLLQTIVSTRVFMVSHKHKTIFVHIPKTGGTSIEQLIWPVEKGRAESDLWMGLVDGFHNKYQTGGLQHLLAIQIRQELGANIFNEYFKFCFVRNPWDKAISQFSYMKKRQDLRDFIGMKAGDCFKRYLELIKRTEHVQWMPQYKFVFDGNGESLVDFVGYFEKIERDIRCVLSQVGLEYKYMPHLNKSERDPGIIHDAESYEMIKEMYSQDFISFGY
jgi:hypothetical protein